MKKRNKILIVLITVTTALFCVICFVLVPIKESKQAEYAEQQQNALTHDISLIEDCRTQYIGNAVNVSQLFEKLPLNNVEKRYEIDTENCALTVSYLDTVWNIGEQKVRQDLVYNTIAAMASIDNLSAITYKFPGDEFSFSREDVEKVFEQELSTLLEENVWHEKVQNNISDENFLALFYPNECGGL